MSDRLKMYLGAIRPWPFRMNGSVVMESGKQEKGGVQAEASHYATDQMACRRKVSRTKGRRVVGHNDA
jgi:hypothetical protein